MNLIFLSSLFPQDLLTEIQKNSKGNIDNAGNALQWHILKGLSKQLDSMEVINAPHIGSFPFFFKKLFISEGSFILENKIKGTSLRYCNLSFIKNKIITSVLTKKIKSHLTLNTDTSTVIVVYGMLGSYVKAAINIKRSYPAIKICLIIPDLPEYMNNSSGLIWSLRLAMKENIYKYINRIDGFILLADAMAESLNIQNKPWARVEGMIDPEEHKDSEYKVDISKKIVLYTGTLASRYGILDLLEAFEEIKNEDYELWICGAGNTEETIKQKTKSDKRIKFMGLITREKVLELQKSATVLVNPRSSQGEYTKYSFPSKTMEYLLSGKPVIMRKLPGIPLEYHAHLFFTKDDSVTALKNCIVAVCELDQEKRNFYGNKSRDFVLKEKNHLKQTKKIIQLINKL